MNKKQSPIKDKEPQMSLEEATAYLKKLGEWEGVVNMNRETILKWAEFLKKKDIKN